MRFGPSLPAIGIDPLVTEKKCTQLLTGGAHRPYRRQTSTDQITHRFVRRIPSGKFEPANGLATLSALAVETDDATGLALRVAPVRLGGQLSEALPHFWA